MKYTYLLIMATLSLTAFSAKAESEMDSEINDLQVRIIKIAPKPKAKPVSRVQHATVTPKIYTYSARPAVHQTPVKENIYSAARISKPVVVASNTAPVAKDSFIPSDSPSESRTEVDSQGNTNTDSASNTLRTAPPTSHSSKSNMVRRIELLSAFTSSSFDGSDSSTVIPSGVSNSFNSSFTNVMLLTDVDFGSSSFFAESGLMLTQMGAQTGVEFANGFSQPTTFSEKVVLTYLGVPLNLKWRMSGEETSSLFIKAGAIPMFMMGHSYSINSNISQEYRFGAYNTFDLLLDAGVGYDFKVWRSFHAILDLSAYQGLFPVLANDSVLNYGFMVGLGAAYVF